jgi:transposase
VGDRGNDRTVLGDRGYDAAAIQRGLWAPNRAVGRYASYRAWEWVGRWRWVVERRFAWLNQFRRLRVRYDKRADIHDAFLSLGGR